VVDCPHDVAAQVEFESKVLKRLKHILASSAESIDAFNTGFDTVKLHRPTMMSRSCRTVCSNLLVTSVLMGITAM
jgi:hypothetical protein